MKESQTKKIRWILPLIFIAAFIMMLSVASAEDIYSGTVNSAEGAKLYDGPGTKDHKQINNIVVAKDTELQIYGEEKDSDGDTWYRVYLILEGVEYEGYLYSGRVTKGALITPTPEPTAEPTQEVTPEPSPTAVITSVVDESTKSSTEAKETTKEKSDDSDGFGPWKWIIILVIVIIIFMLIYTIWVKKNEERLEREIERYSGKSQYEPLEGETEEDYEEARSNYYDHIGLGGNSDKNLAEEIGGKDDVKIDMSGVFDDEPLKNAKGKTKDFAEDATLSELIASLESKLGKSKSDDLNEEVEKVLDFADENEPDETDAEKEVSENEEDAKANEISEALEEAETEEVKAEEAEEETEPEEEEAEEELEPATEPVKEVPEKAKKAEAKESKDETVIPEFVKKGGTRGMKNKPQAKPEKAEKADAARFAEIFEEEVEDPGIMDVRDYLETLREGEVLVHKIYGEGKVVDNSDSEIIQVAFGKNMRYLKKEKLVQKDLIIL